MFAAHFFQRISGGEFAGAIESHDASLGIENGDQGADRIENRRDHVAFLLEGPSVSFKSEISKATP